MSLTITRKLNVGVIGGSLSGLFSAMALQSCNHNVTIFEKIGGSRKGAGITITAPLMKLVDQFKLFESNNSFLKSIQTCSMSPDGALSCKMHEDTPRYHTTWDVLYQNCVQTLMYNNTCTHPALIKNKCLENIIYDDNKQSMRLEFADNSVFDCDLIIGADGIGSQTRKYVSHIKHDIDSDVNSNMNDMIDFDYTGYVAWRGVVSYNQIKDKINININSGNNHDDTDVNVYNQLIPFLDNNRWVLYHGDNTQFLNYICPNYYDSTNLLYNWVWYIKYSSDELKDSNILCDKYKKYHLYSMPRGFSNTTVINHLKKQVAPKLLPKVLVELVGLTKEPFFQVIYDYQCDTMVNIFNDVDHDDTNINCNAYGARGTAGIALVGDAAFVLRPHTTRATSKAAGDALALKKWFEQYSNGEISFSDALNGYNNERHPIGVKLSNESIQFGNEAVLQENQPSELSGQYIRLSV